MKTSFAVLCLGAILVWARLGLAAPVTAVVGIRGNESNTERFAERNALPVLASKTREFDNDNTFVQFQEDLYGQDVVVLLPRELSPNQLMEALIKIRTARTQGARHVSVASDVPLSQIKVRWTRPGPSALDLPRLAAIAGADSAVEPKGSRSFFRMGLLNSQVATGRAYLAGGETNPGLFHELSDALSIPILDDSTERGNNLRNQEVYFLMSAAKNINEELFRALSRVEAFKRAGASVHLITPYLPYARSDKVDQGGVTVIGRLAADLIEGAGTDAITFARAHAPQSQGFFKIPSFQVMGRSIITKYLREKGVQVIVSPDAGFQKDATLYAKEMGLPIAVINKARNPITSELEIKGISGDSVKGKIVALVDDETASGSTFAEGSNLLMKLGAQAVYAVATHLTGSGSRAIESPNLAELVVTNTLPTQDLDPRVKVLSIGDELIEQIRRLEAARARMGPRCGPYGRILELKF